MRHDKTMENALIFGQYLQRLAADLKESGHHATACDASRAAQHIGLLLAALGSEHDRAEQYKENYDSAIRTIQSDRDRTARATSKLVRERNNANVLLEQSQHEHARTECLLTVAREQREALRRHLTLIQEQTGYALAGYGAKKL